MNAEYMKELLRHPRLDEQATRKLIRKAQSGDITARDRVITANLRLVIHHAKRYQRWATLDDLVAEGNFGLFEAVDRFDLARGTLFSTYASWWILLQIRNYLPQTGLIHVPSYMMERLRKLNGGRIDGCGMTPSQAQSVTAAVVALDRKLVLGVAGGDDQPPYLLEPETREAPTSYWTDVAESHQQVIRAMSRLDARERDIIHKRIAGQTLLQISKKYDLSRERIRQIHDQAVAKVREMCHA